LEAETDQRPRLCHQITGRALAGVTLDSDFVLLSPVNAGSGRIRAVVATMVIRIVVMRRRPGWCLPVEYLFWVIRSVWSRWP
jgi:hypothetical protein